MAQYSVARKACCLVVRMEQKWADAKEHHLAARSVATKDDGSVARWVDWKAALTVGYSAACSVKCWAEWSDHSKAEQRDRCSAGQRGAHSVAWSACCLAGSLALL